MIVDAVDFPVEEGKVRELARAIGSDDLAAVPVTFAVVAGHWRDQAAMVEKLGLDIRRVVVGGSEWEHHAPVRVGDRLRGERVVVSDETREGRRGPMRVICLETRLARDDGELAVVQRDTVIEL